MYYQHGIVHRVSHHVWNCLKWTWINELWCSYANISVNNLATGRPLKSLCTLSTIQSPHRNEEDFTEGKRKTRVFPDWPTCSLSCLPVLRKWSPDWLEISTVLTLLWAQWLKSCCVSGWKHMLFRKDFSCPINWNLQPYKKASSSQDGVLSEALVLQHTLPDLLQGCGAEGPALLPGTLCSVAQRRKKGFVNKALCWKKSVPGHSILAQPTLS